MYTDHMPILAAIHKSTEPTSGRQARQLSAIAEATTDIQPVAGKDNVVADALSRIGPFPVEADEEEEVLHQDPGFLCNQLPVTARRGPQQQVPGPSPFPVSAIPQHPVSAILPKGQLRPSDAAYGPTSGPSDSA